MLGGEKCWGQQFLRFNTIRLDKTFGGQQFFGKNILGVKFFGGQQKCGGSTILLMTNFGGTKASGVEKFGGSKTEQSLCAMGK